MLLHISGPWDRAVSIPWLTPLETDRCCCFCFWCVVAAKLLQVVKPQGDASSLLDDVIELDSTGSTRPPGSPGASRTQISHPRSRISGEQLRPRGRSLSSGVSRARRLPVSSVTLPASASFGERPSTDLVTPTRPTRGIIRRVRRTDSRDRRKPETGKKRGCLSECVLGLATAGSTCSPRLAPIELVLLGSRLLDQPIPRSRCSLTGSLPLHEESAGHDDTHRPSARAYSRPPWEKEREEVSPQVGGRSRVGTNDGKLNCGTAMDGRPCRGRRFSCRRGL